LAADLRLAWELARRRRLMPRLPHRLQGAREIKDMFKKLHLQQPQEKP